MADNHINLNPEKTDFAEAVYGKDVRASMVSLAEKIEESVNGAIDDQLLEGGDFVGLKTQYATAVPANADYNTYTTAGSFYTATGGVAQSIVNGPPTTARHRLYVLEIVSGIIAQFVVTIASAPAVQIYKRRGSLSNGTWTFTDWNTVVDSDNLANSNAKNDTLVQYIAKQTDLCYVLPQNDFVIGIINDANGNYSSSYHYRITTSEMHVAETDLLLRSVGDYRIKLYLYKSNGTYDRLYNGSTVTTATLTKGQKYKLSIGKQGTTADAVISEYYDKVQFLNPIQKAVKDLEEEGGGGSAKLFPDTDFGVVPKGFFFNGIDADDYEDFGTGAAASGLSGTDIFNVKPAAVYAKFRTLAQAHSEYMTEWHYTDSGDKDNQGLWVEDDDTEIQDIMATPYAFVLDPVMDSHTSFSKTIPTVYIISGQHGFEKASPLSLYYLFKHMLGNTVESPVLQYLRQHCRIVCMPVANPRGFYDKTYTKGAVGDAETPKTDWGVNLNRNWNWSGWKVFNGDLQDLDNPADTTFLKRVNGEWVVDYNQYTGEDYFSEMETRAARDLYLQFRETTVLVIDYHTNGVAKKTYYEDINDILYVPDNSAAKIAFENAIRSHINDVTAQFITQYNLPYDITAEAWNHPLCGRINFGSSHTVNDSRVYFDEQGVLACEFETCAGFPNGASDTGMAYQPDLLKASEELISNFIITVLNYLED